MCNHYWADISTHEDVGKQRKWICTKCSERAETSWDGPFEISDDSLTSTTELESRSE